MTNPSGLAFSDEIISCRIPLLCLTPLICYLVCHLLYFPHIRTLLASNLFVSSSLRHHFSHAYDNTLHTNSLIICFFRLFAQWIFEKLLFVELQLLSVLILSAFQHDCCFFSVIFLPIYLNIWTPRVPTDTHLPLCVVLFSWSHGDDIASPGLASDWPGIARRSKRGDAGPRGELCACWGSGHLRMGVWSLRIEVRTVK